MCGRLTSSASCGWRPRERRQFACPDKQRNQHESREKPSLRRCRVRHCLRRSKHPRRVRSLTGIERWGQGGSRSTDSGETGSSSSGGSTTGTTACGNATCDNATQVCCATLGGGGGAAGVCAGGAAATCCTAIGAYMGATIPCTSSASCSNGQVCCFSLGMGGCMVGAQVALEALGPARAPAAWRHAQRAPTSSARRLPNARRGTPAGIRPSEAGATARAAAAWVDYSEAGQAAVSVVSRGALADWADCSGAGSGGATGVTFTLPVASSSLRRRVRVKRHPCACAPKISRPYPGPRVLPNGLLRNRTRASVQLSYGDLCPTRTRHSLMSGVFACATQLAYAARAAPPLPEAW